MILQGKIIGLGITGSHCTLAKIVPVIREFIKNEAEVYPVISPSVQKCDTRFGGAEEWVKRISKEAKREPLKTIMEVEPFGPGKLIDVMVIAPCTGNTLAKLSNGITDTAVLMAAKSQLRNQKPVVIAVSTNDGLGINLKSMAVVLNTKNIYLVPFYQDDPGNKPNSIVSRMDLIVPAVEAAVQGKQIQPLITSGVD